MPRRENPSPSESISITLAAQSVRLLERVARKGTYGKTRAEVAARYVERRLEEQIESGFFKLEDPLAQPDPLKPNNV
jgi:hypothetical protein